MDKRTAAVWFHILSVKLYLVFHLKKDQESRRFKDRAVLGKFCYPKTALNFTLSTLSQATGWTEELKFVTLAQVSPLPKPGAFHL